MTGITWSDDTPEVFQTVTGTVVLSDNDTIKLFVDWGDGTDQSIENGVNQWITLERPTDTSTITHTYTQTGTFYPAIRTVNSAGFVSKYMGSTASNANLYPWEIGGVPSITVSDGTPLGQMKIENKTVLSGIDNNIFREGAKDVYIQPIPIIASSSAQTALLGATLRIRAECVVAVLTNTLYPDIGYETKVTTLERDFALDDKIKTSDAALKLNENNEPILRIMKVKLMRPKVRYVTDEADPAGTMTDLNDISTALFNKLKIFLIAKSNDGSFYPITYITNGDPIKSLDDKKRNVKLDFSQSRAKASNVSVSTYTFDNGKVFWQPKEQWQASSSTAFTDATKVDESVINEQYTYTPRPDGLNGTATIDGSGAIALTSGNFWVNSGTSVGLNAMALIRNQFLINDYNQFFDSYHLTRVVSTTETDKKNDLDTFDSIYKITPSLKATGSRAYFLTSGNYESRTRNVTSGAYYNTKDYPVSTSSWNSDTYVDAAGYNRDGQSYFVLANSVKTNKVFFNMTPYAQKFNTSTGSVPNGYENTIQGVYYLRLSNDKYNDKFTQRAEWVPLEFEDTTKIEKDYRDTGDLQYLTYRTSLVKSGYVSFDMPSDWSQISIQDLCGGFFNMSGQSTANTYAVTGAYSIKINAVTNKGIISSSPFNSIVISGTQVGTLLSDYTDADIGSYNYVYEIDGATDTDERGQVYWVASSNIADNKIFLASGTGAELSAAVSGKMRRINAYEVFGGASKTSNIGSVPNYENDPSTAYQYNFMFGSPGAGIGLSAATISGSFQNVYPLRIVISGTTFDEPKSDAHQEMWNILPFNDSNSQVIRQIDNTAYDLNYIALTSDVAVTYAGTFYQAISKGGSVFIVRTGTPIQTISFGGTAMGDESSSSAFGYGAPYTSYYTLRKLRKMQAQRIRVMWDEKQKDGTFVRFFGIVTSVVETHKVGGPRATRPFTFDMVVEEICLMDYQGFLESEIEPLGGIPDARKFI